MDVTVNHLRCKLFFIRSEGDCERHGLLVSRDLGTRHRAAIGMSEHSDAVVVVVSEETGVISCVIGGVLRRYLTPETLERVLREELLEDSAPPVRHRLGELFGKMRNSIEEDDHAEK